MRSTGPLSRGPGGDVGPTLAATTDRCARDVMDVVPLVMRVIRTELRRGAGLASIPQLRTLGFVDRNPHASLTDVATHLGVTTATTSALVDRLVRRRLLSRMAHPGERRRIVLSLTRSGDRHLSAARSATRRELARALASASSRDLAAISRGMAHLREIFGPRRDDTVR